jgi:hypothetical protein
MRFDQWWRRAVRAGHAFAEGARLHRNEPMRHNRRALRSIALWAVVMPIGTLGAAVLLGLAWPPAAAIAVLVATALYGVQCLRIAFARARRGTEWNDSIRYALFVMVGKFAELSGVVRFLVNRLFRKGSRLIEYKSAAASV